MRLMRSWAQNRGATADAKCLENLVKIVEVLPKEQQVMLFGRSRRAGWKLETPNMERAKKVEEKVRKAILEELLKESASE